MLYTRNVNKTNKLLIANSALNDIDDTVIQNFIEENLDENYTVELKDYQIKGSGQSYSIRKALASFANNQGGFLIIGIKDKKNSKNTKNLAERVTGFLSREEPQKWIDDICKQSHILPRPQYDTKLVQLNNKNVLVIKVSPYMIGPIAVKSDGSDLIEFWVRGNGSDIAMDYTTVASKYNVKGSSLIKRGFMDLNDTIMDILHYQKKPFEINGYNSSKITSSFVDDRLMYYEMIGYNEEIMLSVKNLKGYVTAYNGIVELGNAAHFNGKTIGNSKETAQAMGNYLELAGKEVINIVVELHTLFPDEGGLYFEHIKRLSEEHDDKSKEAQQSSNIR